MRLLGFSAVVLSCSLLGFRLAGDLSRRVALLRGLCSSLILLKNEICISLRPVWDVLSQLAEDKQNPAADIFSQCLAGENGESFCRVWKDNAFNGVDKGLNADECRVLAELGSIIGRFDADKQREQIDRVIAYFEERTKIADDEKRRQFKLRAALGFGSGLLIAIMML